MNIRNHKNSIFIFNAAIALVLAFFCTTAVEAQVTTTQQGITFKNVRNWTENGNVVPVCWENPGYSREKEIFRAAVSNTWQRFSSVRFTGWAACPAGGIGGGASAKHVRIRITAQGSENSGAGGSARIGMDALSSSDENKPGMKVSFNPDGTAAKGRVEYIAVHEFGHILGFVHEQDTPGNIIHGVAQCKSSGIEANATSLTAYDRDSIMNYCNKDGNSQGNLTIKDINGLQRIYGQPTGIDIRRVLAVGKIRTESELSRMSAEDQRNTLIVVLSGLSNQPVKYYQGFDNSALAGKGAVLVSLRAAKIRNDAGLKTMSDEDHRNTLIVETSRLNNYQVAEVQSLNNQSLALVGFGSIF